jgi:hypothetical protein
MNRTKPLKSDPEKVRAWQRKSRKPIAKKTSIKKRNRNRHAKNHVRSHGESPRIEFVKALPCLVCGYSPCEVAHVGNGGMSRKSDASKTVPLCGMGWRRVGRTDAIWEGHHRESHRFGIETFQAKYGVNMEDEAAKVEAKWQDVQSHINTNGEK